MAEIIQKINWIDILIVIILVRSSYTGFTRGFGWEFFRVLGYIGVVLATIYYYEYTSQLISDYLPAVYPISNLLTFSGIYSLAFLIIKLINIIIEKIIRIETFSTLEKTGGLLLGFMRGGIILSFLLTSLMFTPVPYFEKSIKERSYMGKTVSRIAPFLYERIAAIFPGLKFGQRNEALSKLTGLKQN